MIEVKIIKAYSSKQLSSGQWRDVPRYDVIEVVANDNWQPVVYESFYLRRDALRWVSQCEDMMLV